jgi:putative peptide zinc metalloprotease protein
MVAGPAAPRGGAARASLPPLRDELVFEPGPAQGNGAPSWTLYDPPAHRYYRIGWLEFEILCRWHLGSTTAIAERIGRETTLRPEEEDVERFIQFLQRMELLAVADPASTRRLSERRAAGRRGWLTWLMHHYLFIRLPLLTPDRLLDVLLPRLAWVYSRAFLAVTLLAGLLGAYLALRQWDSFAGTFLWFFSLEGAVLAGAALVASKCLHELGHGLTAKRFGCRVPSMGLALVVLTPMLYTDTSAAWRLRDRRKRLAIGAAGVAAECCLAAYALLLWSFLPDGALRSVVFVLATTTWILTLLVNMSPFMRFDGYFLFADLIDVPNLQDRAFALARHWLREMLFGFGEEPPEFWPPRMRRLLIGYAVTTWVYRFFLFLGIALVVYHMFFKLLGILLFTVELWWFIARPVMREIGEWTRRRHGQRLNMRSSATLAVLAALILIVLVPWSGTVYAPALMVARERVQVFSQVAGQVSEILVRYGDQVEKDTPLVAFASPDLAYKAAQATRRVASLEAQVRALTQDAEQRARVVVLGRELDAARSEAVAATAEHDRLRLRSPLKGGVVEIADPLGAGEWIKAGELVAVVADISATRINAYVSEADLGRLVRDGGGTFVPADPAAPRVTARLVAIDDTAVRILADRELASTHGGPLAVRPGPNNTLVPEVPVYRVTLAPEETTDVRHTSIGTVLLRGTPASIAGRVLQRVLSVLIRESGF